MSQANVAEKISGGIKELEKSAKETYESTKPKVTAKYLDMKTKASAVAADPKTQVTVASAAGGAAVLGTSGGAIGLGLGGSVGAACGTLPAIFTFGLSIPIGALIGGTIGLCAGVAVGGATGVVGGGAVGYGAYTKRKEIKTTALTFWAKIGNTTSEAKAKVLSYVPEWMQTKASIAYTTLAAKVSIVKAELLVIRKQGVLSYTKPKITNAASYAKAKALAMKAGIVSAASDRKVQVTAASGAGGAMVLGTAGGGMGMLAGGAIGGACGLLPAVFTFGLSIPIFAFVGGGVGLCAGVAVGSATGGIGCGAAGYTTYTKRGEISNAATKATAFVKEKVALSRSFVSAKVNKVKGFVKAKYAVAEKKVVQLKSYVKTMSADRKVQVTTASAATGAVTLGATGGAVGLAAGGTIGAAIGFIPAIFTFGLSIPIGAAIGGATGACTGAVVGGTAGLVGGGTVGYGAYSKRKEISGGMDYVKDKASEKAKDVKALVRTLSGTGGTE